MIFPLSDVLCVFVPLSSSGWLVLRSCLVSLSLLPCLGVFRCLCSYLCACLSLCPIPGSVPVCVPLSLCPLPLSTTIHEAAPYATISVYSRDTAVRKAAPSRERVLSPQFTPVSTASGQCYGERGLVCITEGVGGFSVSLVVIGLRLEGRIWS